MPAVDLEEPAVRAPRLDRHPGRYREQELHPRAEVRRQLGTVERADLRAHGLLDPERTGCAVEVWHLYDGVGVAQLDRDDEVLAGVPGGQVDQRDQGERRGLAVLPQPDQTTADPGGADRF